MGVKLLLKRLAAMAGTGLLLLGMSADVRADSFVPGFTGFSQFLPASSTGEGIVNFAVYENTVGTWTSDFNATAGVGALPAAFSGAINNLIGAGVDAAAKYVYFYQIVNNDPPPTGDDPLDNLFVMLGGGQITASSAGYVKGFTFEEGSSAVGPPTNQTNDAFTGFTNAAAAGAYDPHDATRLDNPNGSFIRFSDYKNAAGLGAGDLPNTPDSYTSLIYITSNFPPIFKPGRLTDFQDSFGPIPVPTPEPASLALMLAGAPFAAGFVIRRRRKNKVA